MGDLENVGRETNQLEKSIFRILDFYESTLIPMLQANPDKILKRIEKQNEKQEDKIESKTIVK